MPSPASASAPTVFASPVAFISMAALQRGNTLKSERMTLDVLLSSPWGLPGLQRVAPSQAQHTHLMYRYYHGGIRRAWLLTGRTCTVRCRRFCCPLSRLSPTDEDHLTGALARPNTSARWRINPWRFVHSTQYRLHRRSASAVVGDCKRSKSRVEALIHS